MRDHDWQPFWLGPKQVTSCTRCGITKSEYFYSNIPGFDSKRVVAIDYKIITDSLKDCDEMVIRGVMST